MLISLFDKVARLQNTPSSCFLNSLSPSYFRGVWYYKDANTQLIRQTINAFNWQRVCLNTSVNEKVTTFNKTILNIISNFVPQETIMCGDKDPPWFNNKIRALIQEKKNTLYNNFREKSKNPALNNQLKYFQERLMICP